MATSPVILIWVPPGNEKAVEGELFLQGTVSGMTTLYLEATRNRDGDTYALAPRTRKELEAQAGGRLRHGRLFLARELGTEGELTADQRVAVMEILTGLGGEEVRDRGVELQVWAWTLPPGGSTDPNWLLPRDPSAP